MDDRERDEHDRRIDSEIAETIGRMPGWDATTPGPELRDRVLAIGSAEGLSAAPSAVSASASTSVGSRRPARVWTLVGTAAACLALGAGLAVAVNGVATAPVHGPAGTLGALEHVQFDGEPTGAAIDGDLIAHTWGTETSLRLDGLESGTTYTVVLVARDGTEFDAGTLLGTAGTVTCRMNAAVLRPDVAEVIVRAADDSSFGSAVVDAVS